MQGAVTVSAAGETPAQPALGGPAALYRRLRAWLPQGRGLTQAEWRIRHRAMVVLILAHAVGLALFGLAQHWSPVYAVGEGLVIGVLGVVAALPQLSRSMRSGVAALALVTSSAVLTQFWGGVIEGHFHFFIVVALISLYQDWVPFLLAIAYVVVDHGVIGTVFPQWVYNHPDALANPWKWASVHAVMVLAECVALVVVWRANEKSREETDRILRSADEGILGIDREGVVTFANPAAQRMLNGSTAGSNRRGQRLYEVILGPDGKPAFDGPGLLRGPGAVSVEGLLAQADGGHLPIELLCTPFDQSGEAGAVVAIRDVSERQRVEGERQQAREHLRELRGMQETSRFKAQFINTAAHELRTPLMPLRSEVHIMLNSRADPPNGERRKSLEVMERNLGRLSTLVDDLLTVARSDAGRLGLQPAPVDMRRIVAEAVDSFAPSARQKGIALESAGGGRVPMVADAQRVSQVLLNLLNNALKFTPAGGRIAVSLLDEGDDVRIAVRDSGLGLSPQDQARLFRPFVQVHDTFQVTQPGSGLGLYICRQFVEMHGGRIEVESPGRSKGSTFWFTLPKAGPPKAKPAVQDAFGAASTGADKVSRQAITEHVSPRL
ncbi:MAG: two-component system, NarL family, sensor histidine kinase BarA [Thermoplasmata archaeon]|nr:two-component system, NarL family, sensor histidine kinase BarA [Thermoplasmata archaeon]